MAVAAGPFTTSDSLLYEPLADLMRAVQNDKPDLLILVSLDKSDGQVHSLYRYLLLRFSEIIFMVTPSAFSL